VEYEDVLTIPTPEGVEVRLTLAGLGSRFVSAVVDALIQGATLLAVALVLALAGVAGVTAGAVALSLWTAFAFVLVAGYDVLFEVLARGRTPGKRLNGLRVVLVGGAPIGFLASAVRNVLRIVDLLPFAYLVGMVSILVTEKNQRLGDVVAGTLVVRERRAATAPPAAPSAPVAANVDSWDTSAVTAEEHAAVRSFLERRGEIEDNAREELGTTLAERLRPKVAGAPLDLRGEEFLEALTAAMAKRR
jgi:uncharacterized RDD family membrane protein YckC